VTGATRETECQRATMKNYRKTSVDREATSPREPGWSYWVEYGGRLFKALTVSPEKFGPHKFERNESDAIARFASGLTGECACGCFMMQSHSGGLLDPRGPCPLNPKEGGDPQLEPFIFPEVPFGIPASKDESVWRDGIRYFERDSRAAEGWMAPFLGRRYTCEELVDDWERNTRGMRVWRVPTLEGASMIAPSEAEVPATLLALLESRCSGIEWKVSDFGWPGYARLRKHGIVHDSIVAPPETGMGQPMALEIFARVQTEEGFFRRRHNEGFFSEQEEYPPLPGPLTIILRTATYANVRFPRVGVPLY